MSAYLVILPTSCDAAVCSRRAAVSVFNGLGQHVGHFCQRCGKRVLAAIHRSESVVTATRRSA